MDNPQAARYSRRSHDEVAPAIEWTPQEDEPGAFRVGHSKAPHLADGMTAIICIGGGAFSTIPNPQSYQHGGIVWHLTYSANVRPYVLAAGSVISTFDYLLSDAIGMGEATRRLKLMRRARAALASPSPDTPEKRMLLDLLAVIHRDGGHYTDEHGLAASVADAMLLSSERLPDTPEIEGRGAALEEAAKVADQHNAARLAAKQNALERKQKGEARDHESMAIEAAHIGISIRALAAGEKK